MSDSIFFPRQAIVEPVLTCAPAGRKLIVIVSVAESPVVVLVAVNVVVRVQLAYSGVNQRLGISPFAVYSCHGFVPETIAHDGHDILLVKLHLFALVELQVRLYFPALATVCPTFILIFLLPLAVRVAVGAVETGISVGSIVRVAVSVVESPVVVLVAV